MAQGVIAATRSRQTWWYMADTGKAREGLTTVGFIHGQQTQCAMGTLTWHKVGHQCVGQSKLLRQRWTKHADVAKATMLIQARGKPRCFGMG